MGSFVLTTLVNGDSITITFDNPGTAFGLWFGNDDFCCSNGFDAVLEAFNTTFFLGASSLATTAPPKIVMFPHGSPPKTAP